MEYDHKNQILKHHIGEYHMKFILKIYFDAMDKASRGVSRYYNLTKLGRELVVNADNLATNPYLYKKDEEWVAKTGLTIAMIGEYLAETKNAKKDSMTFLWREKLVKSREKLIAKLNRLRGSSIEYVGVEIQNGSHIDKAVLKDLIFAYGGMGKVASILITDTKGPREYSLSSSSILSVFYIEESTLKTHRFLSDHTSQQNAEKLLRTLYAKLKKDGLITKYSGIGTRYVSKFDSRNWSADYVDSSKFNWCKFDALKETTITEDRIEEFLTKSKDYSKKFKLVVSRDGNGSEAGHYQVHGRPAPIGADDECLIKQYASDYEEFLTDEDRDPADISTRDVTVREVRFGKVTSRVTVEHVPQLVVSKVQ
jgi:hypothetical protein